MTAILGTSDSLSLHNIGESLENFHRLFPAPSASERAASLPLFFIDCNGPYGSTPCEVQKCSLCARRGRRTRYETYVNPGPTTMVQVFCLQKMEQCVMVARSNSEEARRCGFESWLYCSRKLMGKLAKLSKTHL